MTRIGLGLMWLLRWLPFPLLAACGRAFGHLFYRFGRQRRHIALTNLGLCFPQLDEVQKSALAQRHFEAFGRSFLERGLLWWAAPERIRQLVRIEHGERLAALQGRPLILLVPHFVGLDTAWTRLALEHDMCSLYANQKNPVFNARLYRGRQRFGRQELFSRQQGVRPALKSIKSGRPFFYLPDLDYGKSDAIFVPFFGVQAATITGLSRLARLTGAAVLPVIARMTDDGYVIEVGEAWSHFPGEDIETDTVRMNAFIEQEVVKMPEQYFWLHRRFKSRPPGERRLY
ncbi:MAG: lipid A biosynthesis acyltransferase [Pseudomonadota bacterium]